MSRRARLLLVLLVLAAVAPAAAGGADRIEMFSRRGCPRCEDALRFLDDLRGRRADVEIVVHDVVDDPGARERLEELAAREGVAPLGVPAFLVGGRLVVGFAGAATSGARLEALLSGARGAAPPGTKPGCAPGETACAEPPPAAAHPDERAELPLLGEIDVRDVGLPLFTIAVGLLDGFNPCAMWVLLFVLSLLVNVRGRSRMLVVGGTFVVVSGLVYFAFMAAWLNAFLLVGVTRPTEIALGLLSILAGLLGVKDFFVFGRGPSLAIPAAAKPGLYARVRTVLQAESLAGAIVGIAGVAVLVNVVELACTAGLPVVYTRILTMRELPSWSYYGYLALYNVAYVADDAAMLALAVATLTRHKLQERAGRWLKLVSGAVMLALGATLMLRPDWLAGG